MNKTKKYAYKANYLKASVEEAKEIVAIAKLELEGEIRNIQIELNVYDPVLDDDFIDTNKVNASKSDKAKIDESIKDDETNDEKPDETPRLIVPDWAKKIYRKITLKTHPDRLIDCDKDERVQKTKIYTRVTSAYAAGDYSILVMEAIEMGLSLPEEKDIHDILSNKCKSLEKKLAEIKETLYWLWYHGDDRLKKEILNKFVNSRGWTRQGAAKKKSRNKNHPGKSLVWARKKLDSNKKD